MGTQWVYAMYADAVNLGRKKFAEQLLEECMYHNIDCISDAVLERLPSRELNRLVSNSLAYPLDITPGLSPSTADFAYAFSAAKWREKYERVHLRCV